MKSVCGKFFRLDEILKRYEFTHERDEIAEQVWNRVFMPTWRVVTQGTVETIASSLYLLD